LPPSIPIICGESVAVRANQTLPRTKWVNSRLQRAVATGHSAGISLDGPPIRWFFCLVWLVLLSYRLGASSIPPPEAWVPIRWTGGPLELAWRTHTKTLPNDASVRDALARWYEPATLNLLDGSPVNCLLVSWSAPTDAAVEAEQQQLVETYAGAAHHRNLAVLGLVYAAGNASKIAADAARASLDGLVLEGEFTPQFADALRKAAGSMVVIEIAKNAAGWRWKQAPVIAVAGVPPSGRNLSEMGIRGSPSSQPWIESNIWLVRSFALASSPSPVWISSQLESTSTIDYLRAAADAAAAGGRWIIAFDDVLRLKLRGRDASALETWHRLLSYVRFAESHAATGRLDPYGNVAIVLDRASTEPDRVDEYLKLATRRQVPYQLISRGDLNATTLAKFRAIVATELDPPSATERTLLHDFGESGGMVFVGPAWGSAPRTEPFVELPAGKGSVIVYKDPDPDAMARDLKELLSDDDLGVVPFNVPSVITFAKRGSAGKALVVQLVNYFDHPVEAITLRLAGNFHSARLETPEAASVDLSVHNEDGRTEVTIPKLLLWGVVSMQ
jgi:hypothetical protein